MISIYSANIAFFIPLQIIKVKMKRTLPLAIIIALLTTACTNYKNIEVRSVKLNSFKLVSTSRASIELEYIIDNPTGAAIILSSGEGIITKKGLDFAQLEVQKPDTLPPRTVKNGKLVVNAVLLDPMSLLSMGLNISSWKAEDFHVNTKMVFRTTSGYKKTLRHKNIPLKDLINKF